MNGLATNNLAAGMFRHPARRHEKEIALNDLNYARQHQNKLKQENRGKPKPEKRKDDNYILNNRDGEAGGYWVAFSRGPFEELKDRTKGAFKFVIAGSPNKELDFFAIPYALVRKALELDLRNNNAPSEEGKRTSKTWDFRVDKDRKLTVGKYPELFDVSYYYGKPYQLTNPTSERANANGDHIDDAVAEPAEVSPADLQPPQLDQRPTSQSALVDDLNEIERREIESTTKDALISARVGQGTFRTEVLRLWADSCAVTCSLTQAALRASHIKPWSESTDEERLDPNNGLPLVASLDALFDAGLISFEPSGKLVLSPMLSTSEREIFGLSGEKKLKRTPPAETAKYLAYHRRKHGFEESE